ncbi:signal peptidase II [Roseomonas sp. E05]|uniref:signal peptidase II n=1 Tax=Roseomonas sp. E05 TaxID=3046310 RepID=UPI0024BA7466|nr:signal peptidase II [Roseomonas sp. E05]MDJ0391542.1 signal peptidase II [Roseomonas sp. E05]
MTGGAVGNIADRVRLGTVTDFLDFHVAGYHWPTFNLADTAIFIGVALILLAQRQFGAVPAPSRAR